MAQVWGDEQRSQEDGGYVWGAAGDIQADAEICAPFDMRLPGVIEEARLALENNEQVVISVVSVGEVDSESGSLAAAVGKINTHEVEKIGRIYSDPMEIPEALAEIAEIKDEMSAMGVMLSPVDVLRDAFGDDVAFVTGATSTKDRIQAQKDFQRTN